MHDDSVTMPALLYESHMHTPLCKHASGLPGEYAEVAERRGLRGIIVTCHAPLPNGHSSWVRMDPGEFPKYLQLIEDTASEWSGRMEILPGLESDYIPGFEDWLRELHDRAPLHHVLGSVHPQIQEYRDAYYSDDPVEYQKTYFRHLGDAAESGLFDTLAHPDLIKNEPTDSWNLERIFPEIMICLDRVAEAGCAMELNTSGLNKRVPEMNPGPEILREMAQRGIPVVIGADAHVPSRAGDRYIEALNLLSAAGFQNVSGFRERKRFDVPIADAIKSLRA